MCIRFRYKGLNLNYKTLNWAFFLLAAFISKPCLATTEKIFFSRPNFYLGAIGGYGSTTWTGLVPTEENKNPALSLSTPIATSEGGFVYGGVLGCEFTPFFALEASYLRYPSARITFDSMSIFSFENQDLTEFQSNTETVTLLAKLLLPIENTKLRIFSGVGATGLHRKDILINNWTLSPSFSAGLNYLFNPRWMSELAGNFTAGNAESSLNPANTYYPFLYSVTLRLAYRI